MKITYDKEVDAAYIYIKYPIEDGESRKNIELNEDIILDFDKNNKLLGVEVLNASKHLHKEIIAQALVISA